MDDTINCVEEYDTDKSQSTCTANDENDKQSDQSLHDDGETPKVGMIFNSMEEVEAFYKKYALKLGFDVMKRRSTNDDGFLRYFSFACAKNGKPNPSPENSFKSRPSKKTDCKAKINATLREGKFILSSIVLEHNHGVSPSKVRFYKGNKHIDAHTKKRLELNDQAGIPLCKNYNVVVEQAGGYENLLCGEKDCRNYIDKVRRLKLGDGDAEAVHKYFVRMRKKNPQFYHLLDIDNEGHLRNIFWADARSRAAYESFGDVVCFDSTYLTNKYDMPFAPFVGVNHHGQSILLGCGLLSSETTQNYIWLFEAWLECMSGNAPQAIITDQCKAIEGAIREVFPNTFHGLCRWHIMNKLPNKLSRYKDYYGIKSSLQKCVYETVHIDDFEGQWRDMVKSYKLEENEWLMSLYNERERWAPVFTKRHFLAGMSSSQRSESMNSFFDGYINSRTSLKQFVEQYEKALKKKIENEARADFDSFNANLSLVSSFYMENQIRKIYTNTMFKKFQEEIKDLMYCSAELVKRDGMTLTFAVRDWKNSVDDDGKIVKEVSYKVTFNAEKVTLHCVCCLFEFRGILCRHTLCVLMNQRVTEIPSCYILTRWRKDIKRPYNFMSCSYDDLGDNKQLVRYNQLYTFFNEAADMGSQSDYLRDRAKVYIGDMISKLSHDKELIDRQQVDRTITMVQTCANESQEREKVLSPLKVNRKGRPNTKRKVSNIEKIARKNKPKVSKLKKNINLTSCGSQVEETEMVTLSSNDVIDQFEEEPLPMAENQLDLRSNNNCQGLSFTQMLEQYGHGAAVGPLHLYHGLNQNAERYYNMVEPTKENEQGPSDRTNP